MALDKDNCDRNYLFGRLLAIAEEVENYSLRIANKKRPTNAEKLMHQFKIKPLNTWGTLADLLQPHFNKLGARGKVYSEMIADVVSQFNGNDFISKEGLSSDFLFGYYCQRKVFNDQNKKRIEASKNNNIA